MRHVDVERGCVQNKRLESETITAKRQRQKATDIALETAASNTCKSPIVVAERVSFLSSWRTKTGKNAPRLAAARLAARTSAWRRDSRAPPSALAARPTFASAIRTRCASAAVVKPTTSGPALCVDRTCGCCCAYITPCGCAYITPCCCVYITPFVVCCCCVYIMPFCWPE